jgi:hypothetical protein
MNTERLIRMIASLAFGRQIRLQRYVRHIHGAKSALKDFGRTLIGGSGQTAE